MEPDLDRHPLFEATIDHDSGVKSYLLSEHVAPAQQSLYFSTPSVSADGKWLWFMCVHPPGLTRTVGVVSLDHRSPLIRHFPQVQYRGHFEHAACAAPPGESPGLYVCQALEVYKLGVDGSMRYVASLPFQPHDFTFFQFRPSCVLSISSDRRRLLLTGLIKERHFIAVVDLRSGEVELLKEMSTDVTYSYFSPTEPDLFFVTARRRGPEARLWLMDVPQRKDEPVTAQGWSPSRRLLNHEFWSGDGWLCWVDLQHGAFEWNPRTHTLQHVWRRPMIHAHATTQRQMWCADINTYNWNEKDVRILLFDRASGREIPVVNAMPPPSFDYNRVHCHPHPRFVIDDRWLVYTASNGRTSTVALCPIQQPAVAT